MCESEGERTNTPYASEREKQTGKDGHAWCTGRAVDGGEKAWAALPILRQISQPDAEPTSKDVAKLLSTPVTGIASTLGPSQEQLANAAVRFEEAVARRKRRARSILIAGPRITEAHHLLRLTGQGDPESGWADNVALEDIARHDPRPDSRSPCKFSHLRALARNLVRNAG